MITSPFQNVSSLRQFIREIPSAEVLTEQVLNNMRRLAELEKRVPNYLKEKEFAFVDLRSAVITLDDIEDYEYDTADVNQFCENADKLLTAVELRVAKLGL
jgi:hypothetical protein